MSSENSYYVPEQSKLPLAAATGMGVMAYGAASWVIEGGTSTIFLIGTLIMASVMFMWWSLVIKENTQGIVSDQLKHSYVLGMYWFIFSELMFFVCFFGSLFYVRVLVGPWLDGEAAIGWFDDTATDAAIANATHLWPGYDAAWPPIVTPDQVVTLAANPDATEFQFKGPKEAMSFPGWSFSELMAWLPLWSGTVHIAHHALKEGDRKKFVRWLGLTVLLGIFFLFLQAEEYIHAYQELGLTLESGIYGTTFFLLTGFHGAHVTLGTIMLLIAFLRGAKGHFNETDHFGFEAAAWYWHFVDVIWVGLFLIVYVLG